MKKKYVLNASDMDAVLENTMLDDSEDLDEVFEHVKSNLIIFIREKIESFFGDFDDDEYYALIDRLNEMDDSRAAYLENEIEDLMTKWYSFLNDTFQTFTNELN